MIWSCFKRSKNEPQFPEVRKLISGKSPHMTNVFVVDIFLWSCLHGLGSACLVKTAGSKIMILYNG